MVTNRVYKVLATAGGVAAANLAAVTAGKYAVLKKDGTVFTAGDTIAAGDVLQIATGSPDGTIVFSDKIKLKDITSFEKQAYRAKVEQVVTVTVGAPVAGTEYTLTVNDRSDKEILPMRQSIRRYSVVAGTGDTATTVAAKFAAKISVDRASIVTATSTDENLVLTAKSVAQNANAVGEYFDQYFFEVSLSEVDNFGYFKAFGAVVYTTVPDYGSGNIWQVRKLEQRGAGYTGITNLRGFPAQVSVFQTVSGTNYDVYVIEHSNTHDTNTYIDGRVKSPISTILCVAAGQGAGLEAILNPLIGSEPAEAVTVEG